MRGLTAALGGLVLAGLVTGCSQDPQEEYCAAVSEHRQELSETLGQGGPTALLQALPTFRTLQGQAPDDIADDWQVLVDALGSLEEAVEDAGADPASYDRENPPAGVSPDEQARIDVAAAEVGGERTRSALAGVEQHARDVCHTPLIV